MQGIHQIQENQSLKGYIQQTWFRKQTDLNYVERRTNEFNTIVQGRKLAKPRKQLGPWSRLLAGVYTEDTNKELRIDMWGDWETRTVRVGTSVRVSKCPESNRGYSEMSVNNAV